MIILNRKIKFYVQAAFLLLLSIGIQSCKDTWDTYYGLSETQTAGADLYTTIKSTDNLKVFTQILNKSGYDKVLSSSKSFTVFAPTDSAFAANGFNVENTDSLSLVKIVQNHVSISSIGTPHGDIRVNMLNNKYIYFKLKGNVPYFGEYAIEKANGLCSNGVLHTLKGVVPFAANIYQTIGSDTTFSKVYNYLKSYELRTYDLSKSVYVGINSKGQKVYDTLWVSTNAKLNRLGRVDLEDSVYTAIIPTNAAYNKAFSAYRPYFITYNATTKLENKDSTDYLTKIAVVNDLVFRGVYGSVAEMPDTLVSTVGSKIPRDSLKLTESGVLKDVQNVSNGTVYTVNELYEPAVFKFFKEVSVEGDASLTRAIGSTTSAYARFVDLSVLTQPVSGNKYLYMESNNTTDEATATFTCNNVLSGSYDIYCVVVPALAESKTDSTRLSFTLTSRDAASKLVQKKYPSTTTADYGAANYLTSSTQVKEVLIVRGFKFPFSNTTDLTVKVSTSVATSETAVLSKKVRIDRILFKPSK